MELFYCPSSDETVCSEHVEGGGWEGLHDEGAVLRSLFCLLMWEVLFASVPDVFVSAYQDAPLDLFFPCFYKNR